MSDQATKGDVNGSVDAIVTAISIDLPEHTRPDGSDKGMPADALVRFDDGTWVEVPLTVAKNLRVGQLVPMPRKPGPDFESWARSKMDNSYE